MPLLTVRLPQGAILADALRVLLLTDGDVDIAYGLISLDPADDLYALRITDAAAARLTVDGFAPGLDATIFADPRIEPADDAKPPE